MIWERLRYVALALAILTAIAARSDRIPPVAVAIEHGPILPHEGTARLRVTVDPQSANRGLWTAIESDGYATAHYEELNGARSPKTRWVSFPDLPDGEYTCWVRLLRDHGEKSASVTFIVGSDAEPAFP
jgi:hypothetical protein